jgi:hypothetical protein
MAPEKDCPGTFEQRCMPRFDNLEEWFEKLEKRLFEDNGGECVQSKLNRLNNWVAYQQKVTSA